MNQYVKIPIIKRKKNLLIKYYKYTAVVAIFMLFHGAIFDNLNIMLFSVFIIIVCIILLNVINKYHIIGIAVFYYDHFKLTIQDQEATFNLKDLENIKIKYYGYDGKHYPNPKSLLPKDGTGNLIYFTKNNQKYSYELLFKKSTINILNTIIEEWKNNDKEITLIGEWGFKIKSL